MSGAWRTVLVYLHPVASGATIALAAYAASLGLRARRPGRNAGVMRHRHATLAPWVYALMLASWVGGVVTTWALRSDIEVFDSGHFTVGSAICALLTAGALVSRRVPTDPRARVIHPLLGATALLLCGVQVFLGLQLTP